MPPIFLYSRPRSTYFYSEDNEEEDRHITGHGRRQGQAHVALKEQALEQLVPMNVPASDFIFCED